ncbi:pyridoxamine 5'-phosphate oxidase family protein [Streptomyces sp. NPDC047928]|uniref:pyridoxamine 5'-phosphate oxidase family protein n=1 Tax=unclassified Streptomyces TaxID=2593676 RepID=UPI0037247C7A
MIKTPHHEGEQAVQRRANEGHAGWGSPMFGDEILPGFDQFMLQQRMLIIGGADGDGAVWASVLHGEHGFIRTLDRHTIGIGAELPPGDPLSGAFEATRDIGMLVIEPQTARRIRINGVARRDGSTLRVRTEQVLGNCPKYLQLRMPAEDGPAAAAPVPRTSDTLDAGQRKWIETADTFFIGSRAPEHGADASHRGGEPGFVAVTGPRQLTWPDYLGNSFYMTLGNLQLDPACGLLFIDWERGDTLQLTGTARIDWDERGKAAFPGALRTVVFDVERVVHTAGVLPLRWEYAAPSPYNPPAPPARPAGTEGR